MVALSSATVYAATQANEPSAAPAQASEVKITGLDGASVGADASVSVGASTPESSTGASTQVTINGSTREVAPNTTHTETIPTPWGDAEVTVENKSDVQIEGDAGSNVSLQINSNITSTNTDGRRQRSKVEIDID